jgi:hypothetical protein
MSVDVVCDTIPNTVFDRHRILQAEVLLQKKKDFDGLKPYLYTSLRRRSEAMNSIIPVLFINAQT